MKPSFLLASAACAALLALTASAETLYAVSMRTYADPLYKGVEGNLYAVSTETAVTRLVASLSAPGKGPVGLDGIAIHPKTGVFYGITSTSANLPHTLVTVDVKTGIVTPVGDLGVVGSDIEFESDGTLYMWIPATFQMATVNIETGAATPRGRPYSQGTMKGGLALIGGGRALVAATGGKGTLDTIDLATGTITTGPTLVGAPFPELVNGLTFSPKGVVYGINTNGAQPPLANLISIDQRTGAVTNIGPLPNDTDALSFGPDLAQPKDLFTKLLEWRFPLLVGLFLIAIVVVVVAMRHKP